MFAGKMSRVAETREKRRREGEFGEDWENWGRYYILDQFSPRRSVFVKNMNKR